MSSEWDVLRLLRPRAEIVMRLRKRRDGTDADLLGLEQPEPLVERTSCKDRRELDPKRLLAARVVLAGRELGTLDHLTQAGEEGRFERGHGQESPVCGLVHRVAGEAACEEAGERIASDSV